MSIQTISVPDRSPIVPEGSRSGRDGFGRFRRGKRMAATVGGSERLAPSARAGGPRTAAGKRRSAANRLRTGLCPPWVTRDLKARGEDPARFGRLHRELIAWLAPGDARTKVMVQTLAETWWEKLRRARNWVGSGAPDTTEIDSRLDELLRRFGFGMLARRRTWRGELQATFGNPVPGPAMLRRLVEARVPALGGKPSKRPPWRTRRLANSQIPPGKADATGQRVFDLLQMWNEEGLRSGGFMPPPAKAG